MKLHHLCSALLTSMLLAASSYAMLVIEAPIESLDGALGFGNAPTALTLHENGDEEGAVEWHGPVDMDVFVDDADDKKSATVSAGDILADFGSSFGVFFNISENDDEVDLSDLTVTFYSAAGAVLASASIDAGVLMEVGGGQGSGGHFFELTDTAGEISSFLSDPTNRIGLSATIDGTSGGAETFRIAAVPEPSSFLLLALVGLGYYGYRFKQSEKTQS